MARLAFSFYAEHVSGSVTGGRAHPTRGDAVADALGYAEICDAQDIPLATIGISAACAECGGSGKKLTARTHRHTYHGARCFKLCGECKGTGAQAFEDLALDNIA
jgi:DnaJ-class molecular chaperone